MEAMTQRVFITAHAKKRIAERLPKCHGIVRSVARKVTDARTLSRPAWYTGGEHADEARYVTFAGGYGLAIVVPDRTRANTWHVKTVINRRKAA